MGGGLSPGRNAIPLAVRVLPAILLAASSACVANAWQALTAENLPKSLQAHSELVLRLAREGNSSIRAGIAFGLRAEGEMPRARLLLQEALEEMPVEPDDPKELEVRQDLAVELSQMLIEGQGGAVDVEAGMALLAPLARAGLPAAVTMMRAHLLLTPQLPRSYSLTEGWREAEEEGVFRSHADHRAEGRARPAGLPNANAFGACTNFLGDVDGLLRVVGEAEEATLHDPVSNDSRLRVALATAAARDVVPADSPVSLYFASIPAVSLFVLSTMEQGFEVHFADAIRDDPQPVGVWVTQVPRTLVAAWLMESFGWRARCADGWVLVEPDPEAAEAPSPARPLFLGPIASIDVPGSGEKSASGEIVWLAGARYSGEISLGQPHGRGTLYLPDDTQLSGEFRNGLPHGPELRLVSSGHEKYRGAYEQGRWHGLGRLVEIEGGVAIVTEGRFERGLLAEGVRGLSPNAPPSAVSYRGPLRRGEPHGDGECSAGEVRYRCGFVEGDLVSIGGVGVYPRLD